ncbi:hypothetical protein [Tautonia rosea]|nr:hypothetical protein [Tautonia rosea]
MANGGSIPGLETGIVGKNSPRSKVSGGCSDGAVDIFGLSTELGGGGGATAGAPSTETTSFSFALEKPVLALLPRLLIGQEVVFSREQAGAIAARAFDQVIGFVPVAFRSRVSSVLDREGYIAVVEDIAHHTIRVRVTG